MWDAALQPQAAACWEGYKRPGKSHFKNQKVPDPHLKKKKKRKIIAGLEQIFCIFSQQRLRNPPVSWLPEVLLVPQ